MTARSLALLLLALAAVPAAAQDSTVVYLVRHAEKAAEPADDPPLTPAGEARARALADLLREEPIDALLVTQFRRTAATAAPLAGRQGIEDVRVIPTRGTGLPHAEQVAETARTEYRGKRVLVVGHSNTVPAIVHALGGPALPELCDAEHARLFVVVLRDGEPPRVEVRGYGAPDPPGADACERG
jgi:broad specificity phosphatase PhoE